MSGDQSHGRRHRGHRSRSLVSWARSSSAAARTVLIPSQPNGLRACWITSSVTPDTVSPYTPLAAKHRVIRGVEPMTRWRAPASTAPRPHPLMIFCKRIPLLQRFAAWRSPRGESPFALRDLLFARIATHLTDRPAQLGADRVTRHAARHRLAPCGPNPSVSAGWR
jgi:hypothetical protein